MQRPGRQAGARLFSCPSPWIGARQHWGALLGAVSLAAPQSARRARVEGGTPPFPSVPTWPPLSASIAHPHLPACLQADLYMFVKEIHTLWIAFGQTADIQVRGTGPHGAWLPRLATGWCLVPCSATPSCPASCLELVLV